MYMYIYIEGAVNVTLNTHTPYINIFYKLWHNVAYYNDAVLFYRQFQIINLYNKMCILFIRFIDEVDDNLHFIFNYIMKMTKTNAIINFIFIIE